MFQSELLSKEWCDLVFEGRNKDYGAYALRAGFGRRNRFAVFVVCCGFTLVAAVPFLLNLYLRHTLRESMREITALSKMKPLEAEEGHRFRVISAGRKPTVPMAPDAKQGAPVIVDGQPAPHPVGLEGPLTLSVGHTTLVNTAIDSVLQNDPLAPVTGEELTPTEVVEQMPHFPGGITALMKWLDQHVVYPPECQQKRIQGEVRVSFIVAKTGEVREAEVTKKVHPALDDAALAAVRQMPKWQPGKVNGKVSVVRVTIPVAFQMN